MKTIEKKRTLERWRENHRAALEVIAREVDCTTSGLTLWRKLSQIYGICLDYTNGDDGVTLEVWEQAKEKTRDALSNLFGGRIPHGIRINGDPRGSCLKLDCNVRDIPAGMWRDMGGDGMLAAVINEECL